MGVYEENIVPVKLSRLAEYVSERKHLSLDDALVYIYSNPMYAELYDEGAKWWYLSTEALFDEFERARRQYIRTVSRPAFEFYVYTMEKYAISRGLGGLQAFALFKEYEVDEFLMDHYDLLHTQGTGYVMDEIDLFLRKRKRDRKRLNQTGQGARV